MSEISIKDQINNLIDVYKENFYKETGLSLIVFPDTSINRVELIKLKTTTESILGITIKKSNKQDQVRAKKFVLRIALEMGYTYIQIANCLGWNRTSVSQYVHRQKLIGDYENEREFARYKENLLKLLK